MKKSKLILQSISLMMLLQAAVLGWDPPIGIPRPEFGIEETYRMYDDQANRNPALTYTQNAEGGYYTHYVDNTHPDATNTSNPYGTAQIPRVNLPIATTILPGSVIEIHDGPYNSGVLHLIFDGTPTHPVFIRGASNSDKPLMYRAITVRGHYIILENIEFDLGHLTWNEPAVVVRPVTADRQVHHVAVRNCEAYNGYAALYAASYLTGILVEDVVFYNNHIHPDNMVPPDSNTEPDNIGIGVVKGTNRIWIVDNHIHHLGGDCIGSGHAANYTASNYYIGRNILHDTSENAIDLKEVDTAVISENIMYNYAGGSSGQHDGVAVVVHYGPLYSPKNVWILYNEIYNCNGSGIQVGGDQEYDVQIIGNIIHDIKNGILAEYMFESFDEHEFIFSRLLQKGYIDAGGRVNPTFTSLDAEFMGWFSAGYNQFSYIEEFLNNTLNSGETATGYRTWNCNAVYMINNVFYNLDNGVDSDVPGSQSPLLLHNNIISNISTAGYHISLRNSLHRAIAEISHNIFHQPGDNARIIWGSSLYDIVEFRVNTDKGEGCLDSDPLFIDPGNNNFNLQAGSPAIDAGIAHSIYDQFQTKFGIDIRKDIEGGVRPYGAEWDIGAYEWGSTPADPGSEPEPDTDTEPEAEPEALIPDITALQVMNNIIKAGGNQSALIRCDMKEAGKLTVRIYDSKGKEIITICDEQKEAGRHEFVWTGRDSSGNPVGSGIYIVHLKSGEYSETKKIAIIK